MTEYHVLNFGAGVQSTTVLLMFLTGELHPMPDAAIFSDTQEEPEQVYRHIEWVKSISSIPVLSASAGKLGDDLLGGRNSTGQRFITIPAFTLHHDGKVGMRRRQCSREYKVQIIERIIRREVLGLQPGRHVKGTVHQYFGISLDEAGRSLKIRQRLPVWSVPHFPLIEKFLTRKDCQEWLKRYGIPHEVPRSACVCCPYRSDREWVWLRQNDPPGFERACQIDEALRTSRVEPMFLHRSCVPLRDVNFAPGERGLPLFADECEGVCGV